MHGVKLTLIGITVAEQQEKDGDEIYVEVTTNTDDEPLTTRHPGEKDSWKVVDLHNATFDPRYGNGIMRLDHVLVDEKLSHGDTIELAFFEEDTFADDPLQHVSLHLHYATPGDHSSGLTADVRVTGTDEFDALDRNVGLDDQDLDAVEATSNGPVLEGGVRVSGREQIGGAKGAYIMWLRLENT